MYTPSCGCVPGAWHKPRPGDWRQLFPVSWPNGGAWWPLRPRLGDQQVTKTGSAQRGEASAGLDETEELIQDLLEYLQATRHAPTAVVRKLFGDWLDSSKKGASYGHSFRALRQHFGVAAEALGCAPVGSLQQKLAGEMQLAVDDLAALLAVLLASFYLRLDGGSFAVEVGRKAKGANEGAKRLVAAIVEAERAMRASAGVDGDVAIDHLVIASPDYMSAPAFFGAVRTGNGLPGALKGFPGSVLLYYVTDQLFYYTGDLGQQIVALAAMLEALVAESNPADCASFGYVFPQPAFSMTDADRAYEAVLHGNLRSLFLYLRSKSGADGWKNMRSKIFCVLKSGDAGSRPDSGDLSFSGESIIKELARDDGELSPATHGVLAVVGPRTRLLRKIGAQPTTAFFCFTKGDIMRIRAVRASNQTASSTASVIATLSTLLTPDSLAQERSNELQAVRDKLRDQIGWEILDAEEYLSWIPSFRLGAESPLEGILRELPL
jgi:hypothetical protein